MSSKLIIFLLVEYVIIALVCLIEKRWWLAVYWGAAGVLNLAVLGMGK